MQCSAVVGGRGLQSIELTPTLAIIAVNSPYRDTETVVKVVQTAAPPLPPTPPPLPPCEGGIIISWCSDTVRGRHGTILPD